jgi:hypothetical protein
MPKATEPLQPVRVISTLNEKPLHAALKEWYAQPGDRLEAPFGGFIIDIVRGDLLVEIQTQGFSNAKRKLADLATQHPVRLVYPVAQTKWIVKIGDDDCTVLSRRKSPKRGSYAQIFAELVSFPRLLSNPRFSLHVLLILEEELRRYDDTRAWRRRGWVTYERRLLQVIEHRIFAQPADLADLLPAKLVEPFTTADLASALGRPRRLAQQMAYCLRKMGMIEPVGKQGNAHLYIRLGD